MHRTREGFPPPPPASTRLNGWKDIANHLGKGVRTVQRWEKQYGLPVHRVGADGEVVFAWVHEVDEWLLREGRDLDTEPAMPAAGAGVPEGRARAHLLRGRVVAAVVLLAVALVGLTYVLTPGAWPRQKLARLMGRVPQPAAWEVKGQTLRVFDIDGVELWRRPFEVSEVGYQPPYPNTAPGVWIGDLDGDGAREVVALRWTPRREDEALSVFDAYGEERFTFRPGAAVRFGDDSFAGPWHARSAYLLPDHLGGISLWSTFNHHTWFPSRLDHLAPNGEVLETYWSNGYIESVDAALLDGRPVVLVGAITNEFRTASLAVFDAGEVAGAAPAENPKYRCTTCAPGGPRNFFVFPQLCVGREFGIGSFVATTRVGADGRAVVVVRHEVADARGTTTRGRLEPAYVFDARLQLLRVELPVGLIEFHDQLAREGLLDHPFGDADRTELAHVRRWDGQRFVDLPSVPVIDERRVAPGRASAAR